MICPGCQQENPENSKFCAGCGYNLKKTKTCPECNTENNPLVRFCNNCGYLFIEYSDNTKNSDLFSSIIGTIKKIYSTGYDKTYRIICTLGILGGTITNTIPFLGALFVPAIAFVCVISLNCYYESIKNRLKEGIRMGVIIGVASPILSTLIWWLLVTFGLMVSKESHTADGIFNAYMGVQLGGTMGLITIPASCFVSALVASALAGMTQQK